MMVRRRSCACHVFGNTSVKTSTIEHEAQPSKRKTQPSVRHSTTKDYVWEKNFTVLVFGQPLVKGFVAELDEENPRNDTMETSVKVFATE